MASGVLQRTGDPRNPFGSLVTMNSQPANRAAAGNLRRRFQSANGNRLDAQPPGKGESRSMRALLPCNWHSVNGQSRCSGNEDSHEGLRYAVPCSLWRSFDDHCFRSKSYINDAQPRSGTAAYAG